MEVLATSSDPTVKRALDTTKEMQQFLAAPDGVKNDLGQPAPEMEDKTAQLKRRLFKFYRCQPLDMHYKQIGTRAGNLKKGRTVLTRRT
jgi:hypothetical protein